MIGSGLNISRQKQEVYDLMLGELPLLKETFISHILMTGTTGSEIINTFHSLLPQIRQRGDRALVVDMTENGFVACVEEGKVRD